MTVTHFRRFLDTRPFRRFDIVLVDGRVFTVSHPDFVGATKTGRIITLWYDDGSEDAIDLLHVVSLARKGPDA